jgi:hypothetical protein
MAYTHPAMTRVLIVVLSLSSLCFAQTPVITLKLPHDIPSDKVQVQYFMAGPFGGFGNFIRPTANLSRYMIPAAVDGKPARSIKIFIYMPGCEFVIFDFLVQGDAERSVVCEALGIAPLHGGIVPASAAKGKEAEVSIVYLAEWQFGLEGIMNGMVPMYEIAKVTPDAYGEFDVTLPDFSKNPVTRDGSFWFLLRDHKTWNIIAYLIPADASLRPNSGRELKAQSSYPATVEFTAKNETNGSP